MTEVLARFTKCTVVSIATIDHAAGEAAALTIARRFGSSCRAILVTNEDMVVSAHATFGHVLDVVTGQWRDLRQVIETPKRPKRSVQRIELLSEMARSVGIEADISVLESGQALADVKATPRQDLLILVQPTDPLARQSHPFTELRHAALSAHAPILFVPPHLPTGSRGILVLAQREGDPAIEVAEQVSRVIGEPVKRSGASRLEELGGIWEADRTRLPSIIVTARDVQLDDPAFVSRMTLRLGVPILLIESEA
ncbi:MAG: hypothetical protein KKC43_02270 [Alphaproteobacteria bacterium]|nr:hypothetical protein [Alphaproteobacteria bacterium]